MKISDRDKSSDNCSDQKSRVSAFSHNNRSRKYCIAILDSHFIPNPNSNYIHIPGKRWLQELCSDTVLSGQPVVPRWPQLLRPYLSEGRFWRHTLWALTTQSQVEICHVWDMADITMRRKKQVYVVGLRGLLQRSIAQIFQLVSV